MMKKLILTALFLVGFSIPAVAQNSIKKIYIAAVAQILSKIYIAVTIMETESKLFQILPQD